MTNIPTADDHTRRPAFPPLAAEEIAAMYAAHQSARRATIEARMPAWIRELPRPDQPTILAALLDQLEQQRAADRERITQLHERITRLEWDLAAVEQVRA